MAGLTVFQDREDRLHSMRRLRSAGDVDAGIPCTHAVAMVVVSSRIVLVRDRAHHRWELPGGFIAPDETPSTAIVREVFEESGLVVRNLRPIGLILVDPPRSGRRHPREAGMVFSGSWDGALGTHESDETSQVALFAPDRLPEDMAAIDRDIVGFFLPGELR